MLTFPISSEEEQRLCVEVAVDDDERVEDTETFHLEISTKVPRIRIRQSTATVRVEDNDVVEVAMTSPQLSVEEGEKVNVCITRNGVIEKTVIVDLSLEPGTAQGRQVYSNTLHHLSLVFLPPQPDLISTTSTSRSSSPRRPWPNETSVPISPPSRTTWWS